MTLVSTDDMKVIQSYLWFGHVLGYAAANSNNIYGSHYKILRSILLSFFKFYFPDIQTKCILGFRYATKREQQKSRLYNLQFDDWKLSLSHHLVIFVRDSKPAQLMISCGVNDPNKIEIIDVDRVDYIRFLIWLGKQLFFKFHLHMDVFLYTIMPTCFDECEFSPLIDKAIHHVPLK
jgi:hypothetical protein